MKRNSYLLIITAVLSLAFVRPVGDEIIIGFSPENSARQEALEDRFDAMLTTENLRTWMKHLTARPQHVGSPQGAANAEYVRALFNEWGFKTEIETYYILFPTPKELSVELVAPEFYRLKLEEPMIEEDASSQVRENLLPHTTPTLLMAMSRPKWSMSIRESRKTTKSSNAWESA